MSATVATRSVRSWRGRGDGSADEPSVLRASRRHIPSTPVSRLSSPRSREQFQHGTRNLTDVVAARSRCRTTARSDRPCSWRRTASSICALPSWPRACPLRQRAPRPSCGRRHRPGPAPRPRRGPASASRTVLARGARSSQPPVSRLSRDVETGPVTAFGEALGVATVARSRGTGISRPAAASSRSRVENAGSDRPDSIRAIVDCARPALAAARGSSGGDLGAVGELAHEPDGQLCAVGDELAAAPGRLREPGEQIAADAFPVSNARRS